MLYFLIESETDILTELCRMYLIIIKCFLFCFVGIFERQSTERGGSEKVQGKENGNISVTEEEDQKGPTQPESADGAAASENPGSEKITRLSTSHCLKECHI